MPSSIYDLNSFFLLLLHCLVYFKCDQDDKQDLLLCECVLTPSCLSPFCESEKEDLIMVSGSRSTCLVSCSTEVATFCHHSAPPPLWGNGQIEQLREAGRRAVFENEDRSSKESIFLFRSLSTTWHLQYRPVNSIVGCPALCHSLSQRIWACCSLIYQVSSDPSHNKT